MIEEGKLYNIRRSIDSDGDIVRCVKKHNDSIFSMMLEFKDDAKMDKGGWTLEPSLVYGWLVDGKKTPIFKLNERDKNYIRTKLIEKMLK